jgi:hypothetical protein
MTGKRKFTEINVQERFFEFLRENTVKRRSFLIKFQAFSIQSLAKQYAVKSRE